jgi:hypothetical protein
LELTVTPKYFDNGELEPLSVYQIAFFDECHRNTEIGRTGDTVYSFPRNEGGLYDKDGGIGDVDTKLHCKYPKEGRFCVGISAVKLNDGRIEGHHCTTFDYSAKNLIAIMGEEKLIKEELKRVRELKTEGQWVEKRTHLPGRLFENDSVMVLDKIAGKTAKRLSKHGIKTLLDMKMIAASEISAIMADKNFRVSENTLRDWRAKAEQANQGSTPARIRKDHMENDNTYLSRYGPDLWMTKIHQCSALSGYRCVTEMTDHIDNETKRVMKGTKNEGRGLWYHDALSLMTCKKSVQYMKQKGIFDNWLLPWGRLQEGTRYHESIPGDSPELMPLDETLNMDIHANARYHVAITSHAYLRLVDPATGGAPSSTRIVQDCEKWIRSLGKIREAGGKMVQGFGRNGNRERGHGKKRGGYQAKKTRGPAKWVHIDAASMTEQQWRGSVELVNNNQNSSATQTTMTMEMTGGSGKMSNALTSDANTTSTIHSISLLNEEPNNPLTIDCDYFSDIENENDDKKYKRFVMVTRNDDDILGGGRK